MILRPLCFPASLGRSHESANDGLDPIEKRRHAEWPAGSFAPTPRFLLLRIQGLHHPCGVCYAHRPVFPMLGFLPGTARPALLSSSGPR